MNNTDKCIGGPWTRRDPSDYEKLSCLDLVIVSISLYPFIKKLIIDKDGNFSMNRVTQKDGKLKLTPTDHFTFILILYKLQRKNCEKLKK